MWYSSYDALWITTYSADVRNNNWDRTKNERAIYYIVTFGTQATQDTKVWLVLIVFLLDQIVGYN